MPVLCYLVVASLSANVLRGLGLLDIGHGLCSRASSGFDMDVLVVDFQADVLEHITTLARSNIPAEAVQSFFVDVETLPDPYVLVVKSKE